MIVHIVLGKARTALNPYEELELHGAFNTLRDVPGVLSLTWGENFSQRSQGYTHGAVIHFADRAALDAYQKHEVHLKAVQIFERLMPERLVVDYETEVGVGEG